MPDGFCRCFVGAPGWGRGRGPDGGLDPVIHAGVVAPRPRPAGPAGRGAGPSTGRARRPDGGASLGGAATGQRRGPDGGRIARGRRRG